MWLFQLIICLNCDWNESGSYAHAWWLTGTGLLTLQMITGPMWMAHISFGLLYILFSKINKQYNTVQEHQMLLHSPSDLEMKRKKKWWEEGKEQKEKGRAWQTVSVHTRSWIMNELYWWHLYDITWPVKFPLVTVMSCLFKIENRKKKIGEHNLISLLLYLLDVMNFNNKII